MGPEGLGGGEVWGGDEGAVVELVYLYPPLRGDGRLRHRYEKERERRSFSGPEELLAYLQRQGYYLLEADLGRDPPQARAAPLPPAPPRGPLGPGELEVALEALEALAGVFARALAREREEPAGLIRRALSACEALGLLEGGFEWLELGRRLRRLLGEAAPHEPRLQALDREHPYLRGG